MSTPQANSRVSEAKAWATANSDLLTRCFERFQQSGEWPTLEQLQLDFARGGRDLNVAELAHSMPPPLGWVDRPQPQRLVLSTRCLGTLPAAGRLLDVWFAALRIACERWLDEGEGARLTRADVLRAAHGDDALAERTGQILLRERWAFGSGHGTPVEDWSQEVTSTVLIARHAGSAAELQRARDAIEYPPPVEPPATEKDRSTAAVHGSAALSHLRSLGRTLSDHPFWSTLAATLTAALILAVVHWGFADLFGGRTGSAAPLGKDQGSQQPQAADEGSSAEGHREQAGEGGATSYRNPHRLSQPGPRVAAFAYVLVGCRLYSPQPESVNPDGYWYRLLSVPWSGRYYAPANSFWNGDIPGKTPYTHNTDFSVPECSVPPGVLPP